MTDYRALATSYANQAGVNPTIFVNQIQAESGFDPNATSPAGAIGIAQFMPQTAASLGLNPRDPVASLKAAALYDANGLKTYNGDYPKMLAAYNCGGGCVNSAIQRGGANWLSFTPTETQNYVKKIMGGTSTTSTTGTPQSSSSGNPILDTLKPWGEYIAIFLLALLLVIVGLMLLAGKQMEQVAGKAAKTAVIL